MRKNFDGCYNIRRRGKQGDRKKSHMKGKKSSLLRLLVQTEKYKIAHIRKTNKEVQFIFKKIIFNRYIVSSDGQKC